MMIRRRRISLLLFLQLLSGCGVDKELKETRDTVEKATATVAKAMDTMALAVPGERYLRLIDEVHSGDPEKAAKARSFVQSLFRVDLSQPYEVTVWFRFDGGQPLRADIFRGRFPTGDLVRRHVSSKYLNLTDVGSTFVRPPLPNEIRQQFASEISAALTKAAEQPFVMATSFQDGRPIPGAAEESARLRAQIVAEASSKFADAILRAGVVDQPLPVDAKVIQKPWSAIDPDQYLFVVMDEQTFNAHRANLAVDAVVHVEGKPHQAFAKERIYRYSVEEFAANPVIVEQGRRLVWAVHNMTGNGLIDQQTAVALQQIKKALEDYSVADAGGGAK